METYPRDYNYSHFDFRLEEVEVGFWEKQAPRLGSVAPEIDLIDVTGARWRSGGRAKRPLVIEFGSFTCPIFCGHISAMDSLADEFPNADFVVIYTREAHPGELHQAHVDASDRRASALKLLRVEGVRRRLLIDDLDGSTHLRWGGGYNSVFVLDSQNHIVVRRLWNEPADVASALRVLAEGRRPIPQESLTFGMPSERLPTGHEILERAGRDALRDFATHAPDRVLRALDRSTDAVRYELGLDTHAPGRRSPAPAG